MPFGLQTLTSAQASSTPALFLEPVSTLLEVSSVLALTRQEATLTVARARLKILNLVCTWQLVRHRPRPLHLFIFLNELLTVLEKLTTGTGYNVRGVKVDTLGTEFYSLQSEFDLQLITPCCLKCQL